MEQIDVSKLALEEDTSSASASASNPSAGLSQLISNAGTVVKVLTGSERNSLKFSISSIITAFNTYFSSCNFEIGIEPQLRSLANVFDLSDSAPRSTEKSVFDYKKIVQPSVVLSTLTDPTTIHSPESSLNSLNSVNSVNSVNNFE